MEGAIKSALHHLGEHADCVVIIASYTVNKKTHLQSDYLGNQFAAEKMAESFCAEDEDDDPDDEDGEKWKNPPDITDSPTCDKTRKA